MIKNKSGNGTIFSTKRGKKNKLTPLYSYKKGRKANLKRKAFIQPAALKSRRQMPDFFVKAAERMIQKTTRK